MKFYLLASFFAVIVTIQLSRAQYYYGFSCSNAQIDKCENLCERRVEAQCHGDESQPEGYRCECRNPATFELIPNKFENSNFVSTGNWGARCSPEDIRVCESLCERRVEAMCFLDLSKPTGYSCSCRRYYL